MGDSSDLERLFAAARALPAGDAREAFLQVACAGDERLLAQLEALLRHDGEADQVFGDPDVVPRSAEPEVVERLLRELRRRKSQSGSSVLEDLESRSGQELSLRLDQPEGEEGSVQLPGEVEGFRDGSGRYRLLGEIGRGGMGVVLKGRDQDLGRDVALKVLRKDRSHGATVLTRFVEEAQISGQLQHPGIVPVHELGLDADDQVYFSMKLVKGSDLAQVLRRMQEGREGWTRTRTLGVLLKVCEAMAYAHARGVIHRDLKPANIMVGRYGETYVTDWGLARVLGKAELRDLRIRPESESATQIRPQRRSDAARVGEDVLLTMDGDVLGTPSFMSPEQARGECDRMGPATDVYAVGAILYQLLAGHPPYLPQGSRRNAYAIWGLVQDEAPKPIAQLAREAPPELVSICERAMAREPEDRYANMGELADDLRAFLENRVVAAHQTGALIEMRKWVQRNRLLAATAASLLVVAIGGTATAASVLAAKNKVVSAARDDAVEAQESAEAAESEAQRELARAEELRQLLTDMLATPQRPEARGMDSAMLELILDRAAAYLESGEVQDDLVAADLRGIVGGVYQDLGKASEAVSCWQQVVDFFTRTFGPSHPKTLHALHQLARGLGTSRRLEESRQTFEKAARLRERELGALHAGTIASKTGVLRCRFYLGDSPKVLLAEGLELLQSALPALGEGAAETRDLRTLVGGLYGRLGEKHAAEEFARANYEALRETLGDDDPQLLDPLISWAVQRAQLGFLAEAKLLAQRAVDLSDRTLQIGNPTRLDVHHQRAWILTMAGEFVLGEKLLAQAIESYHRSGSAESPRYWEAVHRHAWALLELGEFTRAEEAFRAASAAGLATQHDLSRGLGLALLGTGQVEEARAVLGRWQEQWVAAAERPGGQLCVPFHAARGLFVPDLPELHEPQRGLGWMLKAIAATEAKGIALTWGSLEFLAALLRASGDREGAERSAHRAFELLPETADEFVRARIQTFLEALDEGA